MNKGFLALLTFGLVIAGFVGLSTLTLVATSSPTVAIETLDPSLCDDPNNRPGVCDEVDSTQTATENVLVGKDGVITNIVDALSYVVGIIALIMIIIAGFMFIFSAGNPESAGRATKTIIYAIIGLVVALSAQAIVIFVLNRL